MAELGRMRKQAEDRHLPANVWFIGHRVALDEVKEGRIESSSKKDLDI